MMSTATQPTPLSDREKKILKAALKTAAGGYRNRIQVLRSRGYIDDMIAGELEAKIPAIRLSAGDIDDDGNMKPGEIGIEIAAYERLMKSGKPGSFAKPGAKPQSKGTPNPLKPISSAVALSATMDEEIVEAPDLGNDDAVSRQAQEEAGDELAAMCGHPKK